MITSKSLKSFLYEMAVPEQHGGTYPRIRVVPGDSRPGVALIGGHRVIEVGREWLTRHAIGLLDVAIAKLDAGGAR